MGNTTATAQAAPAETRSLMDAENADSSVRGVEWTLLTKALSEKKCSADAALKLFEAFDIDVNSRASGGRTALHFAVEHGDATMVELLVRRNASTDAHDDGGRSPLRCAVDKGDASQVALLLDRGATVNDVSEVDGVSVFQAALVAQAKNPQSPHHKVVLKLLSANQSLRPVTCAASGRTTYHAAAVLADRTHWLDFLFKAAFFNVHVGALHAICNTVCGAALSRDLMLRSCAQESRSIVVDPKALLQRRQQRRALATKKVSKHRETSTSPAFAEGDSRDRALRRLKEQALGDLEREREAMAAAVSLKGFVGYRPGAVCVRCIGMNDALWIDKRDVDGNTPLFLASQAPKGAVTGAPVDPTAVELILTMRAYLMLHDEMLL